MKYTHTYLILSILLLLYSCSTKKNTAVTRTYHNLTSHYNVYFNGNESYRSGLKKIDKQYKDNYSILLPVYSYADDEARRIASSDMETTLSKMGKTITVHSIVVKPKMKGKMTPRDKALMKKTEYCKWIDDAYILIGKADFFKSEYTKALRAFRKVLNDYKSEDTKYEAKLWIAKVYVEQEKYKDAVNYLTEIQNDEKHQKKLNKDIELTYADCYLRQKEYPKAIEKLQRAIKLTKKRKEKARYYYIIAQINYKLGDFNTASEYFDKVIKINLNYDMTFSAKIKQATAFADGQDAESIKKGLRKMLKDEKNDEYKDQIYYALATIEQKEGHKDKAIEYYLLSASSSVSNDNQKAISFLALADIYFDKKEFLSAGKFYDSTMQYLSANYPDYDDIELKATNTGFLLEYLTIVQNQDSLQKIAKMSEGQRINLINNIIQNVIEEERRQQEEMNSNPYYDPLDFNNVSDPNSGRGGSQWYMYNQVTISRGKNEFKKKWGNRKLEDNWRRKNKTVQNDDSDNQAAEGEDSTRVTDNKKVEYYLQDLPLTDSLMQISDSLIASSLFNAGDVYFNRLNDVDASIKTYEDLLIRYPDNGLKLEIYYRLYKLYTLKGNQSKSENYKQMIISQYPNSKYAKILLDPNFFDKLKATENDALNMYEQTLDTYKDGKYSNVIEMSDMALRRYPNSQTYPNFMFLKAKAYGNNGNSDSLVSILKIITIDYGETDIGKLSNEILTLINSGKFDYDIYKINPNQKFLFLIFINNNINITEFLFRVKLKTEQFTNTKTFGIENRYFDSKNQIITISEFDNIVEAKQFYSYITQSDVLSKLNPDEYKAYFISKSNNELFKKDKMLDKYDMFFKKTYTPGLIEQ